MNSTGSALVGVLLAMVSPAGCGGQTAPSTPPAIPGSSNHEGDRVKYQDYLATTTYSSDEVLEEWRWLIGPRLGLWHVTKAGDALLRDPEDGSIHFLDVITGEVGRIAREQTEFELLAATAENADEWLMPEVVEGQAELGMRPGKNQCLSLKRPPVLGGEIEPGNIEISDIAVHFSIAGQIHRQVKDLPPGTEIKSIKIKEDGVQKKAGPP